MLLFSAYLEWGVAVNAVFGVWYDVVVCNGQYLVTVVWILSVVF